MKINKNKELIVEFKENLKNNKNCNPKTFMNGVIIFLIPFFYILSLVLTKMGYIEFLAYTLSVPVIYFVYSLNKRKIIKKHWSYLFFFFFAPLVIQMFFMGIDTYNMSPENSLGWLGIIIISSFLIFYNLLYYILLLFIYFIIKMIKKYKKSGS